MPVVDYLALVLKLKNHAKVGIDKMTMHVRLTSGVDFGAVIFCEPETGDWCSVILFDGIAVYVPGKTIKFSKIGTDMQIHDNWDVASARCVTVADEGSFNVMKKWGQGYHQD